MGTIEKRLQYLKEQRKINWKALNDVKLAIAEGGDKEEFGSLRSARQGMLETAVNIYDSEICWFEGFIAVANSGK